MLRRNAMMVGHESPDKRKDAPCMKELKKQLPPTQVPCLIRGCPRRRSKMLTFADLK